MSSSPTSNSYDRSERQKIVDYIVQNNLYGEIRGRQMWQRMEIENVCPGRTWQAMRTQFMKNIITSLDTLQIHPSQKSLLLNWYYKKYLHKKSELNDSTDEIEIPSKRRKYDHLPNNNNLVEEHKIKNELKENETGKQNTNNLNTNKQNTNDLNAENQNTDKVKIEGNIENISIIDIFSLSSEEFNKLQMSCDKETDEQRKTNEENLKQESTSVVQEFSIEEDEKVILYIKNNMDWNELKFADHLYEGCEKILTNRTATSIKDRFRNIILPKLFHYKVLDTNYINLFYDRAGIDIPDEYFKILMNSDNDDDNDKSVTIVSNKTNSIVVISDSSDNEEEKSVSDLEMDPKLSEFIIKTISDKQEELRKKDCDFTSDYLNGHLCFNFNDGKHVFIDESVPADEYESIVKDLIYNSSILYKNIHKVTTDKLRDFTKIKTLLDAIDDKILKYLAAPEETRKLNISAFANMKISGVPSVYNMVKLYDKPESFHLLKNSKFYRMMIENEEKTNLSPETTNNSYNLLNIQEDMSPVISLAKRRPMNKIALTEVVNKISVPQTTEDFEEQNKELNETNIPEASCCEPTNKNSNLNDNVSNDCLNVSEQQEIIQQNEELKESCITEQSFSELAENSLNLLEPQSFEIEINKTSNDTNVEDSVRLCTINSGESSIDEEKSNTDPHVFKTKQELITFLSDTKEETNSDNNAEVLSLKNIIQKNMLLSKKCKLAKEKKS